MVVSTELAQGIALLRHVYVEMMDVIFPEDLLEGVSGWVLLS